MIRFRLTEYSVVSPVAGMAEVASPLVADVDSGGGIGIGG